MQCPKCGTETGTGKRFCKTCGTSLVGPVPSISPGAPTRVGTARNPLATTCPRCGSAIISGRAFCGRCGAPIGAFPTTQQFQTSRSSSRFLPAAPRASVNWTKVTLNVGLPLLLVCALTATWHFWPRDPLPPERIGNILDRASSGQVLTFNRLSRDRDKLLLISGENIWDIPTGATYYSGPNRGFFLSPDGRRALSYGAVFEFSTKKITSLENPEPQSISLPSRGSMPNRFQVSRFSNNGTLIAATRNGGSLHIFDAADGHVLRTLRRGMTSFPLGGSPCYITSLAFTPSDALLASGELNGYITLWNTATGDLVASLPSEDNDQCDESSVQAPSLGSRVEALAFSPEGDLLASKDNFGVIRIWDVSSHKLVHVLPFHLPGGTRGGVQFSPDGQVLVTSGGAAEGQMFLVWSVATTRLLRGIVLPGPATSDFLPNGDLILAQLVGDRVKVERWGKRDRLRIPFVHRNASAAELTDPVLLQAYEEQALTHLSTLQSILGGYFGGKGNSSFPAHLEESAQGPKPGQQFRRENYGYQYTYTPGSAGPDKNIASYSISAQPLLYRQSGTRSFWVDQSGQVHATEGARAATPTDPIFRSIQDAMQVAANMHSPAQESPTVAPTAPNTPSATYAPSQKSSSQMSAEIGQWLSQAENQFQHGQYQNAIQSCDAALRVDPGNSNAAQLKAKILETMRILGKN